MEHRRWLLFLVLVLPLLSSPAQTPGPFDLETYKSFLAANRNLESAQLQAMYPAGSFRASAAFPSPMYLDSIRARYWLTPFESQLLASHAFVVTSRLRQKSMISAFEDIYTKDLPVFVSTDAILEAVHWSYDKILMEIEKYTLIRSLENLLVSLHAQLPELEKRYQAEPEMGQMLRDVDVYLTVPLKLLGRSEAPYFQEDAPVIADLLMRIAALAPAKVSLFAEHTRIIDFSQFTVRGHYTQDPDLSHYFQAMMWLGRTELYLCPPAGDTAAWPVKDIQRQTIDAVLVNEAIRDAGARPPLQKIDSLITFMVGESDNVTVEDLDSLVSEAAIGNAGVLLDTTALTSFQAVLLGKSFAFQRINSQILMTDPIDPTQLRPASAFMLLGQRFVIDSYVTGGVVYDKILYNGQKIRRMLPSTLDVLFALGNNAAAQILDPELQAYHYAPNLAGLRYLVDSYDEGFWNSSMFNCWLATIRALNPSPVRSDLPAFMQTGAWWQEKMNTQLASWAQLRHDNLLYAKQSYTGGIITCSFPQSYVEPVPEFYARVKKFAANGAARFASLGANSFVFYFNFLIGAADTLRSIAEKELTGTMLAPEEKGFLARMLVQYTSEGGCGGGAGYTGYRGWYPRLYYGVNGVDRDFHPDLLTTDFVVADVHTAPTDAEGNPVGWVLHVGAGPIDLAIVTAPLPGGQSYAFIGPVLNYYERVTSNFKRLTDQEWDTLCTSAPQFRPAFVNAYLADESGQSRGDGPMLLTGVPDGHGQPNPGAYVLSQNFPNPFNPSTFIGVTIPASSSPERVKLEVFDVQGRRVATLIDDRLGAGNYVVQWDGRTSAGAQAASGTYFYRLKAGSATLTRKAVLPR